MGTQMHDSNFTIGKVKPEPTELATLTFQPQPYYKYSQDETDHEPSENVVAIKKEIKPNTIGMTSNISNTGIVYNDIKIKLDLGDFDDLLNLEYSHKEPGEKEDASKGGLKPHKSSLLPIKLCSELKKCDIYTKKRITLHSNKRYKCTICLRSFKTKRIILKHLQLHADKKNFKRISARTFHKNYIGSIQCNCKCQICAKCFETKRQLSDHLKIHNHERNYKCEICTKCFTTKHYLLKHTKTHIKKPIADPQNYKCEICTKCFTRKQSLTNHLKIHTSYNCDICMKHFLTKQKLSSHVANHTLERNYKCDICKKCFTRKLILTEHVKIHTGERNHKCEICTKCFSRRGNLQAHMKMHVGERTYKCEICTKCFVRKGDLSNHVKIHTGERNYKCEICTKSFVTNANLSGHMKVHTGERNYKCETCMKCFVRKGDLSKHMKIHTGERNYRCEICTKCFLRKGELMVHLKIHTSAKTYKCEICMKVLITRQQLLWHMGQHDNKKLDILKENTKQESLQKLCNVSIGKFEEGFIKKETAMFMKIEKLDVNSDTLEKESSIAPKDRIDGDIVEEKPKSTFHLWQTFNNEIIIKQEGNIMDTTKMNSSRICVDEV